MIPEIKVDTKQVDDLIKLLTERGEDVKAFVFDEVRFTALKIESEAKKSCPVKTGRLRASIKSFVSENPISAVVGTNVSYAATVEFGSKALRRKAKPYLYPAYFDAIGELKERLQNAIGS